MAVYRNQQRMGHYQLPLNVWHAGVSTRPSSIRGVVRSLLMMTQPKSADSCRVCNMIYILVSLLESFHKEGI